MVKALFSVALWLCLSGSAIAAPPKPLPVWTDLNAEHQAILAPLAGEWDKMEPTRRQKWLGIAKRYPKMDSQAQARAQKRMRDWAKLTPEQRRGARERYKKLSTLPPEKRQSLSQKWEVYSRLPDEQRRRSGGGAKSTHTKRAGQAPPPARTAKPDAPIRPDTAQTQ